MKYINATLVQDYMVQLGDDLTAMFAEKFGQSVSANVMAHERVAMWSGVIRNLRGLTYLKSFEEFPISGAALRFKGQLDEESVDAIKALIQAYVETSGCVFLPYNVQSADTFPEVIDGELVFEFFILPLKDEQRLLQFVSNTAMARVALSRLKRGLAGLTVVEKQKEVA